MELLSILHLLSDGKFHSGSELGRALGVSRTAVWKALSQLDDYDLKFETVKGKGYRLLRALDLLSKDELQSYLSDSVKADLHLEVLLSIDSTNTYLLQKESVEADYVCCLAEYQSQGKGRRGRSWVSPFARNLYFSVAFELFSGESLNGLSLVVGISLVKTLRGLGIEGVQLKWPNDVWLDGKKLAGILVELHGEATTSWRVVVGVGLNVDMSADEAESIDQPWVSLSEAKQISRNQLAARLIAGLVEDFAIFKTQGFGVFADDWQGMDALLGRAVQVNGGVLTGVARGIDSSGALLIESEGELRPVNAGEVSVRIE